MACPLNQKIKQKMGSISWSAKRRRSTGSRAASLSKSAYVSRADKELLVYHRRSVQEREEAAAMHMEREEAIVDGLNQLGECPMYTQLLPLPKFRPKPIPKKKKI
jgi:hypothetical protein